MYLLIKSSEAFEVFFVFYFTVMVLVHGFNNFPYL